MRWLVVKTPPSYRNLELLKSILSNRFPAIKFDYQGLQGSMFKKLTSANGFDGVIAVLKSFHEKNLPLYDRLLKKFAQSEIIFVLSPKTYQILNARRKNTLNRSLFLMSETKCLDYLATLPRFIEEVRLRHRLKRENEALQKMFRQNWDGPLPAEFELNEPDYPRTKRQLSIKIENWKRIAKHLSSVGEIEIDQAILRLLSSAIRSDDHVLRRNEDEYLVLLYDLESVQLKKCMKRISSALKGLQLEANEKTIPLRFKLSAQSQTNRGMAQRAN